jgi:hypothetical protein
MLQSEAPRSQQYARQASRAEGQTAAGHPWGAGELLSPAPLHAQLVLSAATTFEAASGQNPRSWKRRWDKSVVL